MVENELEGKSYLQNDHLASIDFQAQPGDIYYMNLPKKLSSYKMHVDNPKKVEKTVGSYISYTLNGTDIPEQLERRYRDFFVLYEKLVQRWPGIYIPRIPPKKLTGNLDPNVIKTRIRLLNFFCLNLSKIDYLYKAEETNIFRNNIPEVANTIKNLPELNSREILSRMKEAFPEYNQNYDINIGRTKFQEFEGFLVFCQKKINELKEIVDVAVIKRK